MKSFHTTRCRNAVLLVATSLTGMSLSGCGGSDDTPELGTVHGIVTLDGEPLPDASIRFQPTEGGRIAIATTDEDGYYELQYTQSHAGAILGKHVVRISTGQDAYEDEGEVYPSVPEKVPVQYNRDALDNPDMNVEITGDDNEINFPLTSEGETVQPAEIDELPEGENEF